VNRIATTLLAAGLFATPMLAALPLVATAQVSIGVSIGIAPPPLPVYEQPVVPAPGYIWTPGYWDWDGSDYYWVPGTWVMPPEVGLLWTPGWWGWSDGYYHWHAGYWAPQVGFYGGIDYGYGYTGVGYQGGYWRGREFYYNRAVNNVNVNIRNVYVNRTVVRNARVRRVSYNGGRGGITARPTSRQRAVAKLRHWSPTSMQARQRDVAKQDPAQHFKANRGHPAVFATQRPGKLEGPHAVRATPASRARPTSTSARPRTNVQAPRGRTQGAPQPRASSTTTRERATVKAPRNRPQPAPRPRPTSEPNRGRPMVQAPHARTQPMSAKPEMRNTPARGNARPNPPVPSRSTSGQRPPRKQIPPTAQSTHGNPHAQTDNRRGKSKDDKHQPGDGQHR
jgi:hypothetical protein